jgi:hypothetical protein
MYITKGKIFNFFILNGAVGIDRNMTVELDSWHPLLPKTGWGKMKI